MLEWLKRHVWKACDRPKRFQGSNPCLSAQMKIRPFRILAAFSAIFLSALVYAQPGVSLELGFPQGPYADATSKGSGAGIGVGAGLHYKYDLGKTDISLIGGGEFNYAITRNEKIRNSGKGIHYKGGGTYLYSLNLGARYNFFDTFRQLPFYAELRLLGSYAKAGDTTFTSRNESGTYDFMTEHFTGNFCIGWSCSLGLQLGQNSLAVGVKDYGKCTITTIESGLESVLHPLNITFSWTRWFGRTR